MTTNTQRREGFIDYDDGTRSRTITRRQRAVNPLSAGVNIGDDTLELEVRADGQWTLVHGHDGTWTTLHEGTVTP